MKFKSAFDIIGPVMVGPSSSHTAGVVRIGLLARKVFGHMPIKADIHFYGSFAKSFKGHASDVAIVAGLLGLKPDDPKVKQSFELAEQAGMEINFFIEEAQTEHPNTIRLKLFDEDQELVIVGISIGGGAVEIIEINGMSVKISDNSPTMLVVHKDAYGAIADVTKILSKYQINIAHMEVSRSEKGATAIMVIEVDDDIDDQILDDLKQQKHVQRIIFLGA